MGLSNYWTVLRFASTSSQGASLLLAPLSADSFPARQEGAYLHCDDTCHAGWLCPDAFAATVGECSARWKIACSAPSSCSAVDKMWQATSFAFLDWLDDHQIQVLALLLTFRPLAGNKRADGSLWEQMLIETCQSWKCGSTVQPSWGATVISGEQVQRVS